MTGLWLWLGADAVAGLLSPEAVMYGLSLEEAASLATDDPGAGRRGTESRPDQIPRQNVDRPPTQSAFPALGGASSATGTSADGPPTGASGAACIGSDEIGQSTLIAYLHEHPALLQPAPPLAGVFRPPRTGGVFQ